LLFDSLKTILGVDPIYMLLVALEIDVGDIDPARY
jgi:hypothetical protein